MCSFSPYVELLCQTNFSFLRGASHPEEFAQQAAALSYPAIGICDRHSLAGVVRAHVAAKDVNIRVLIGTEIELWNDDATPGLLPHAPWEELARSSPQCLLPFSLALFPENLRGYKNLCQLLTLGKRRAVKGHCFLRFPDIESFAEGLLAVVLLTRPDDLQLPVLLGHAREVFSHRVTMALYRHYDPHSEKIRELIPSIARTHDIPLLATNRPLYHHAERRMLHDVLTCVRLGCSITEAGFALRANAERYLKPAQELCRLFSSFPDALRQSCVFAERAAQFSLSQLRYEYPTEICPDAMQPMDYLTQLTWDGARKRYPAGIAPDLQALLQHELQLIEELDYAKYFLTVYDIVQFAASRGILCQGRGAAANSAVCYILGITAVSPDAIKLLFERFISKERHEPPDIDIDFEHERREEVIQYIYAKYGRERAALVAEVICYRTRSAFRDVAKVFSLSESEQELLRRVVLRMESNQWEAGLRDAFAQEPVPAHLFHVLSCVRTLRSFPRHLSQHVGGFVISGPPLCELVPIENAAMENRTVIEWDKDDVDALGMLKIDILGLGMLTCIRKAFELLRRGTSKRDAHQQFLELYQIPPEDPAVYEMICHADTIGVFQIESRAQMNMLPRLRPRTFYDLVIEVAIVRPGPIQGGMVHPFLRRRQGKERVSYPNAAIRHILGPTLGVPIFQEQVMEIAVVAAGFSPGEADELRRAIASWKKKSGVLKQFRTRIVGGMLQRGYRKEFAEQVFAQIQGFGEYGFPQSHAASFALLVYISAWLKHHHPAVFAAALISSQPMGFYRPAQIIQDAQRHGVEILPIDINDSDWDCSLRQHRSALRLGFRLVSGLAQRDIIPLLAERNRGGLFTSLRELWLRTSMRVAALKTLARADAFSSLGLSRQDALWEVRNFRDGDLPLFHSLTEKTEGAKLPELSSAQQVSADYLHTGLSLKAHPLALLRPSLSQHDIVTSADLGDISRFPAGTLLRTAGIVIVRQRPMTAAGTVFLTLEDETGFSNILIRAEIFERFHDIICYQAILCVSGTLQREGEVTQIVAKYFWSAQSEWGVLQGHSRDFH